MQRLTRHPVELLPRLVSLSSMLITEMNDNAVTLSGDGEYSFPGEAAWPSRRIIINR